MKTPIHNASNFWRTVRLLLGAARKRSAGRLRRQQELLQNRAGKSSTDWSGIGYALGILFMAFLNGAAAFVVDIAVESAQRIEVERQGKVVVSRRFLDAVNSLYTDYHLDFSETSQTPDDSFPSAYSSEAKSISERYGGDKTAIELKLRNRVRNHGTIDFVTNDAAAPGVSALLKSGRLTAMLGSVVLFWWFVMLVFQGEGLEMDLQRRRHPMWEWLFTHPVPAGAVFLAEMLSPIAANPIYWCAPLFVVFLYGFVYGPMLGILAGFLVGVPIAIGAACMGKALEIAVILRFSPRSRGAMIGIMSWLGYASMMMFFLGLALVPKIITALASFLSLFTILPWPWLGLFLGGQPDGSFSFLAGMMTCWIIAGLMTAGAVWFGSWGAQQGLSGNFATADARPSAPKTGEPRFGKDPLYRKEFLWFIRDRSAIVQVILIPLTVAAVQMFNMRGLLSHAQGEWNYLCGAAIFFGTYFLWILGPKSLSSEGSALWIALTWPRGLESLLKAKAWLWSMISSGLVALVLAYAAFLFPGDIWRIALVGAGWYFFGRSMAEKAVTLVSVTSSSGEAEKIPQGRRWAAQLGMLTFSIGVLTQQWHIAIMGIVYSYITAAAMWQNFRARLPYLYDPWSEKIPPPPTLMHAMISISILVEGGAVVAGILAAWMGRENIAVAQAIGYGVCAVIVSIGVSNFLGNRGVRTEDVWRWQEKADPEREWEPWWRAIGLRDATIYPALLAGAGAGVILGMFAHGYLAVLNQIPATAEIIRKSQEQMASVPNLRISYAVMAVLFAPFAEEYLFRGLLFRALDREWGGWRAVVGSAAFFAIYHPALSWLPVGLLGVANAVLFKKTGRLAPAVILHTVYNAVVLF
jgi:membrane protease YdiL (CAAX protease family)